MELRNIKTFARIAEVGSFTRVATELGYTQSAVTMQIKQLERELGCVLFERLGRSVRLTPEGERLLPVANRMLQAADEASRIAQEPGEVSGTLRIGVSDSLLVGVLAPVLSELSRTYPRVCVSTHQQMPDEQFAMLRRNDIDVLLLLDERMERPEWVKVFEAPAEVGFVAAATDPMTRRARVPLEEVLSRPLFLTERDVSYRAGLDERIWARGLEATPRVCVSTHQQMPDEQFAMLRRNDIDVLLLLDERMERPEWVKVFEAPAEVGFVAAATDPMTRRARVPLEEVLSRPLFLTERDVSYRAGLDERIWARGLEATPRVECGNTAFLAELVEGCGGVSFLPSCAVRAAVAAGRLAHVDVDLERLDLWHQAIVRKNKVVTPQMRLFLELVQRELCG